MSGRITSNMLTSNYLRNMKRNLTNMKTLQNQLASGKQIQRPSDNPYTASRSMQLNTEMSANKQYNENIKDTSNWLDTTDTALSQMGNIFGRIETLLVNAGNGAYGPIERTSIQDEVKEKVNELSQILNTSFDGSYIFGGTKTASKPTIVVNGVLQYANTEGKAINVYLNAAGEVTSDSITTNKTFDSSNIYLDSNGKITTSIKAEDGTDNIQIIQSSSLYVDKTTGIISTSSSSNANPLLLKDNLYTDLNGNITPSKTTGNTLINSDNELFYKTSDGKVTTSYDPTYTLIPTGTVLYKQSDGKITTSQTTSSVPPVTNEKINASTPLYTDAQGVVTASSVTVNNKLSSAIGSINTLNVSKYTPASGYTQTLIDSSGNLYTDSRGVLTNLRTTDLSMRGAALKDVWSNSYIDSVSQQIKTVTPIPSPNNQINLYKDSSGQVTTSPGGYPANEQILLGTNLYKTSDGQVTTVAGTGTTPMQLTDTVYVDLNGDLTTSAIVNNKSVSVRDNLTISTTDVNATAKAVIGPVSSSDTVIPSDNINLYIDGSGNITNDGTGTNKTKMVLSDSLYLDSHENITAFSNTQNILIDSDDKLYKDANGNVTNSASNTEVLSGTTLYKDATGRVTTLHGGTPPNESIDLNDVVLYKDANGNVTTIASSNGVTNTQINNKTSMYRDVDGNITTADKNTLITSSTQLYKTDNGSVTTDPVGITAGTTQLYKDSSGNVTNIPTGTPPTNALSGEQLYVDANGNVVLNSSASGVNNTPISQTTKLYVDTSTGQVKTKLIKTGDPLYLDSNGKAITSKTTKNTELTANDKIYVDDAKNLTMSSTNVNKALTMSDIKSLKNELQNSSTTNKRKTEINTILNNKDAAQLVQLNSELTVDISEGIKTQYNKTADDILEFKDKDGNSINVSDLLSKIIADLGSSGSTSDIGISDLKNIQSVTANLLQKRSEVGTMQNRMDSAQQNNETQNYNMTDILSKTEDIDIADTTMQYSMMQTIYTAALQTSAKILPMTILSYL